MIKKSENETSNTSDSNANQHGIHNNEPFTTSPHQFQDSKGNSGTNGSLNSQSIQISEVITTQFFVFFFTVFLSRGLFTIAYHLR